MPDRDRGGSTLQSFAMGSTLGSFQPGSILQQSSSSMLQSSSGMLGERWTPLETSRTASRGESGWPSVVLPSRPSILPASARGAESSTRTLRLEQWPCGLFGGSELCDVQLRRFLKRHYGVVSDLVIEFDDGTVGGDGAPSESSRAASVTDSSAPTSSHMLSSRPSSDGFSAFGAGSRSPSRGPEPGPRKGASMPPSQL